ncbi:hypothetical protein K438DRAFT_1882443 [Mycena galopus ATCC 62051]|nr:hypothetical protein K438DRAFT_1882443 [Mycena galopus ATCC 62051]
MICLPPELVETVVSLVYDSKTLKACSLVCTALVAPAQRIIFQSLRLICNESYDKGNRTESFQRVHAALHASPHIFSYIRSLTISFYRHLGTTEQVLLRSILSVVSNIRALVVAGSEFSAFYNRFPLPLLGDFLPVLRLPGLNRVCLLNLHDVPPSFLSLVMVSSRVVLLQGIGLLGTNLDGPSPVLEDGAMTAGPERLDIRGKAIPESMYTAINLILDSKATYLERVHTLEVPMMPDEPAPADRIIAAVATTVQHLAIDYGDCHHPRPNDGLQFPRLPALRSIVLTLRLGQVPQLPEDLYSTITSFPHVMPNIEHITLVFVMYIWEQQMPWQDGGVFALFARGRREWHTQLRQLHRLDCSLDLDYPDSPATDVLFDEFAVHMEERFPALQSTGILTISRWARRRLEPGELV